MIRNLDIVFLAALPTQAQYANALAREINKGLRNAQKLMSSGKAHDAQGLMG